MNLVLFLSNFVRQAASDKAYVKLLKDFMRDVKRLANEESSKKFSFFKSKIHKLLK